MLAPPVEIFISYSVADTPFVERLVAEIQSHSMIAWVGHINLRGGQNWPNEIEKAIDQAQIVLVIWTPEAQQSQYVQKEYSYAIEQRKRVVPLIVKPCKLAMLLNDLHWIDFTDAKAYDDRLASLLNLLKNRETIPLPPKVQRWPRLRDFLTPIIILTVVIASLVGLLASMHGTKHTSTHADPTSSVALTTTPGATMSTTSVPGSPVAATAVVGSAGSKATPPKGGAAPTSPVSSPGVAPTDAPTATPTPTIVPAPTASPTIRIGQ